jgi:osmotically-inducible protein OsmY
MVATYPDSVIQQNVWDELSHDVRIDPSHLAVRVTGGTVYLEGTVPSYDQKQTAAQDARRIKGVRDVVNQLAIGLTRVWADQDIQDTVQTNLNLDSRISNPQAIQVSVETGVVTLAGIVTSYTQKLAANAAAWTTPGVVEVMNHLVVQPAEPRGDAEVTVDVRRRLDLDPRINAALIQVRVVHGDVYLEGSVPVYYQLDEAANDAWSVPGVVNVTNELTVAG